MASPIGIRSVLPSEDLRHCRGLPLSQLGLEPGAAVGVSQADQWTYYFVGAPRLPAIPLPDQREPKE